MIGPCRVISELLLKSTSDVEAKATGKIKNPDRRVCQLHFQHRAMRKLFIRQALPVALARLRYLRVNKTELLANIALDPLARLGITPPPRAHGSVVTDVAESLRSVLGWQSTSANLILFHCLPL